MEKNEGIDVPIYNWCPDIEESAYKQALDLSGLPFIFHHICLMPDAHTGYGMPIGGVIATKGVVIPNAVGVDIGCGVCAIRTVATEIEIPVLKSIMGEIRKSIPVGFNHHDTKQIWKGFDLAPNINIIQKELSSAEKQLGTLGGGNHFIEIQKGSDGYIWIMIHSGSRNFGYKIAKVYNKIAMELCTKWHSNIPVLKGEDGLAFLPVDSMEGKEYLEAMEFAIDFGKENRKHMLDKCRYIFRENGIESDSSSYIDIKHNYASIENHFDSNVYVHRKGATKATKDKIGIIPGSQGTNSYIVKGLGNSLSFNSSSHGSGRVMSRTFARNNLNLEEEKKLLDNKGIIHSIRNKSDLDEATSAYKDIHKVMENQKDLISIEVELTPLAVIKG